MGWGGGLYGDSSGRVEFGEGGGEGGGCCCRTCGCKGLNEGGGHSRRRGVDVWRWLVVHEKCRKWDGGMPAAAAPNRTPNTRSLVGGCTPTHTQRAYTTVHERVIYCKYLSCYQIQCITYGPCATELTQSLFQKFENRRFGCFGILSEQQQQQQQQQQQHCAKSVDKYARPYEIHSVIMLMLQQHGCASAHFIRIP